MTFRRSESFVTSTALRVNVHPVDVVQQKRFRSRTVSA
jgi:hypothetical protein